MERVDGAEESWREAKRAVEYPYHLAAVGGQEALVSERARSSGRQVRTSPPSPRRTSGRFKRLGGGGGGEDCGHQAPVRGPNLSTKTPMCGPTQKPRFDASASSDTSLSVKCLTRFTSPPKAVHHAHQEHRHCRGERQPLADIAAACGFVTCRHLLQLRWAEHLARA